MENTHPGNRRRPDILIWIIMAALLAVFVTKIPSLDDFLAFSSKNNTLLITELMPSNTGTITNEDGEYCDWIELYNPTLEPVNLAGFTITDNPESPAQYVLPYRVLAPGEYAVVYADDRQSTGTELHVPFKLKNSGEMVLLFDAKGVEVQRISFPDMESNVSYALNPTTLVWESSKRCTPGFANTDDGYTAYLKSRRAVSPVAVNEVMPGNSITLQDEDGDYSDWAELYNASDEAVDLSGWGLSDTGVSPKRWEFPDARIGPGEYLVVFLSGKNKAEPGGELHTDFKLNSYDDTILLSNRRGQIVSEVRLHDVAEDMSCALIPGPGQWRVHSQPTPGYPNTADGWNALQENLYSENTSPIVISEVMSSGSTLMDQFGQYPDWIELCNTSDDKVNLSGWGLTDDTTALGRWRFPSVTLSPGEYLTVYASGRDWTASKKKSHTDFSLNVEGEIVVLTDPAGKAADYCRVPFLRAGLSLARQPDSGFAYCDRPTPGMENAAGYTGMAAQPVFSVQAGMYDRAQQVEISAGPGARVYYTLDGTVPGEDSAPYTGPIDIGETTPVRAVAYRDGYLPSDVSCATYLIGENIDLPVVSIVTDPANLFDEETGIYMDGPGWTEKRPHYGANYWQDWERPAHMELIEPDGTVGISQDMGIKIFGNISRVKEQKSFALMSRGEYGQGAFDYRVFPELPYTSYKNLILRCSQDGNMTLIRGALQIGLALESSHVDAQAHHQSLLFINGEFFGIYDLMEKLNEHFIAQHHGTDPDKIDLLADNGDVILGSNEDYLSLMEYVRTHDLSLQEHYDYVASRIDIDNFIDWCAIQIYAANEDLNIKYWRPQAPGGRWRWILYDMDWGFYHLHQQEYAERLDFFSFFLDPNGTGNDHGTDNTLIRGLLENEGFRQRFIERFVYHCTVTFEPVKVLSRIDELAANIAPYMERTIARWPGGGRGDLNAWEQTHLKLLRDFAAERPAINLHYMQQYFGLTDAEMEQLTAAETQ